MTKTFIFTMGLPGAGKTTIARAQYPDAVFIDCDSIKATHPDYDPKNPAALHAWSKVICDAQFSVAVTRGAGVFVYDGTGTNSRALTEKMQRARINGFRVILLFINTSLKTALQRNAQRARTVPVEIVMKKARQLRNALADAAPLADEFNTIENENFFKKRRAA